MKRFIVSLFLVCCLSSFPAWAKDYVKDIQFSHKQPLVAVENSVVRADRDIYQLNAQAGHSLFINFSSLENNGAVEVVSMVNGTAVGGTVEQTPEGFIWHAVLPVTGAYRIIISGTRGNVSYKAEISVSE